MQAKPRIRIGVARFWPGATTQTILDLLLCDLQPHFEFEPSEDPDVLLYGPYPGKMPSGRFVRVFIGSENIKPLMRECDWAFGMWHDEIVNHPRYMRIGRWGPDQQLLWSRKDFRAILAGKQHFCAFVHDARVHYREAFFQALSRYKHIHSPGLAMNNMPSLDPDTHQRSWSRKVEFQKSFKFIIAFENSPRPGYNTERITHAVEADCVPIYWGDPEVGRTFNVRRMINAHDFLKPTRQFLPRLPYYPHSIRRNMSGLAGRLMRKWNGICSEFEQRVWAGRGFDSLVKEIIRVDQDDAAYLGYLEQPLFVCNHLPDRSKWIRRWSVIFESATKCQAR